MTKPIKFEDLPYKSKGDLTNGPVHKHLIRLSIPMVWGILSIVSVQIVDVYYISRLGTQELAAISFVFPVLLVLTHLTFGFSIAISSVVSRLIGEKRTQDVKRVVQHGIFMAFGLASFMAIVTYFLMKPLFGALGADDAAFALISEYMPLWLLAFMVMAIPVNGNSAIRASGDAVRPAIVMVTLALTNAALDPIFIFGLFGAPALGIKGAALATLLAYVVGLVLGLTFLIRKGDLLCLDRLHLDKFADSAKRLCIIALPAGITNIIIPFTNTVIVAALAYHGQEAVAAHGIVNRIEAFSMIAVISLAVGMTPVIGQNWGAQLYDRVHKTLKIAIGFNVIWSLFIAALLSLFARHVSLIFTDDLAVIKYTVLFFTIVPVSYAFGNLIMGWSSAFNAMGKPMRSLVMMSTHAALLMSGVFLGSELYGVSGIFCAIAIVNVTAGLFFHTISWRACLLSEKTKEQ